MCKINKRHTIIGPINCSPITDHPESPCNPQQKPQQRLRNLQQSPRLGEPIADKIRVPQRREPQHALQNKCTIEVHVNLQGMSK